MMPMTTALNADKGLEAAKVAISKFNEVVLPWIIARAEEAKPIAVKAYEKSKILLADALKSAQQRLG